MKTLNLLKLPQSGQQNREEDDRETRKKQVWENGDEQKGSAQNSASTARSAPANWQPSPFCPLPRTASFNNTGRGEERAGG